MTSNAKFLRVAFLFPSLARGGYWQPVLARLCQRFPNSLVITGIWEGFLPAYRDSFQVAVVGRTKFIRLPIKNKGGHYPIGIVLPPLRSLTSTLLKFKPHLVFVSGFSLWTLIAIFLKSIYRWKIIVVYDGSSPSVDRLDYKPVLRWRRLLSRFCDAFISNTQAGRYYLTQHLGVPEQRVKVHPYEVPDVGLWRRTNCEKRAGDSSTVVFLTVGSLIPRKGPIQLMEAFKLLRERSERAIKLLIAGDGPLKGALEQKIEACELKGMIELLGQIEYQDLGRVICSSDVFVFPSLEDVWGVAPLEAMAMGKPVICSEYAGAHELIQNGVNGFVVNPLDVESLAGLMMRFVQETRLIQEMGKRSKIIIEQFTPEKAVEFLAEVVLEAYERSA